MKQIILEVYLCSLRTPILRTSDHKIANCWVEVQTSIYGTINSVFVIASSWEKEVYIKTLTAAYTNNSAEIVQNPWQFYCFWKLIWTFQLPLLCSEFHVGLHSYDDMRNVTSRDWSNTEWFPKNRSTLMGG